MLGYWIPGKQKWLLLLLYVLVSALVLCGNQTAGISYMQFPPEKHTGNAGDPLMSRTPLSAVSCNDRILAKHISGIWAMLEYPATFTYKALSSAHTPHYKQSCALLIYGGALKTMSWVRGSSQLKEKLDRFLEAKNRIATALPKCHLYGTTILIGVRAVGNEKY